MNLASEQDALFEKEDDGQMLTESEREQLDTLTDKYVEYQYQLDLLLVLKSNAHSPVESTISI